MLSEAETRAEHIDPALRVAGWGCGGRHLCQARTHYAGAFRSAYSHLKEPPIITQKGHLKLRKAAIEI